MEKDTTFKIRCSEDDRRTLAELAQRLGVKQSEVIRRAVRFMAEAADSLPTSAAGK